MPNCVDREDYLAAQAAMSAGFAVGVLYVKEGEVASLHAIFVHRDDAICLIEDHWKSRGYIVVDLAELQSVQ